MYYILGGWMGSAPGFVGDQSIVVEIRRPNYLHTEDHAEAESFPFIFPPL